MIKRMEEEAKASFEEMYLTYQDTLRRLAYAYDIPVDDIDDIIQDTFVSYARYDYSLKQPEEGKKILLGRILRSHCMDFHRQKKKRYCEDLNGETFAAEEYKMQLHQPGLVDVFSGKERCKARFHIFNIFRRYAPDKIISGFSHTFLRLKAPDGKIKFFQVFLQAAASISHLELGRIYLSTELLTDE